MLSEINQVRE